MTKDRVKQAFFATGVVVLALLLAPLRGPLNSPFVRHLFDFGHAPLFAAVTVSIYRFLPASPHRLRAAFVAAVLLALAGESVQRFAPTREPSLPDLLLDLTGASLGAAGLWCWRQRHYAWRISFVGLVGVASIVAGKTLLDEWQILRAFADQMPTIATFEQEWELQRWDAKDGTTIRRTSQFRTEGAFGLEVTSGNARYPGVSVEDFDADWSGYRWLIWDAAVPADQPLELFVRLDDDQGEVYGTRYTTIVQLWPGQGSYRVDLADVRAHFREHPMNMRAITELHFFLVSPKGEQRFVLDHVRLER